MGKKRVIKKNQEELIQERENIEKKLRKEVSLKGSSRVKRAKIFISSSYNNTLITLANENGDVLFWKSAGNIGFKGTKKGTSFAGSKVAEAIIAACEKARIREADVIVKGVGGGRDSALKTLANKGLEIYSVRDATPIPHNGCRPKKPRRV